MKAVSNYKAMIEELSTMVWIFARFQDYPLKEAAKEQGWTLETISKIQGKVQASTDMADRIKKELIGDADEAKFVGRIKTAFFELNGKPSFAPSYFPEFDEACFELPSKEHPDRNKELADALLLVYGDDAAMMMVRLGATFKMANYIVQDVCRKLDEVCKFVGYTPELQKQTQEATNTDSLAVEQPEPQPTAQEQQGEHGHQGERQKGEVVLPDVLNTQKTRAIFGEAIKRKWMQPNEEGGYRWLGLKGYERGKQQQLIYMIGQMYGYKKGQSGNEGNDIPCKTLEKLFGVSGIYSLLTKCWEAAKPQAWRPPIDDMISKALQGMTASTSI